MFDNYFARILINIGYGLLASFSIADEPTLQIGVDADFSLGSMSVLSVVRDSPATKMRGSDSQQGSIEPNDVIRTINGVTMSSLADFIATTNKSLDGRLTVIVVSNRTGQITEWTINALPTSTSPLTIAQDTYLRLDRNDTNRKERTKLVEVTNGKAFQTVKGHFPLLSQTEVDFQMLLSELTHGLAIVKNYVITEPQPLWLDRNMLNKLIELIEPDYVRVLSPETSSSSKMEIVKRMCQRVNLQLDQSFIEWATNNGYEIGRPLPDPRLFEALRQRPSNSLTPSLFNQLPDLHDENKSYLGPKRSQPRGFTPRASIPDAQVELLSKADLTLTLLQKGETVETGVPFINKSHLWRRLPAKGATAYGSYYYRFVIAKTGGKLEMGDFDTVRKIEILRIPEDEVVFFK